MAKKTCYPFPNFRVNYHYRGVLSGYKTLRYEAVSETSTHYPPIYGMSRCVLTYNDLQDLTIQVVSLRNNFKLKLDEIYFLYVFLNAQLYQTYTDKKGFGAYMSQLNFGTHCLSTACGISSEHLLAEDTMNEASIVFMLSSRLRKF